MAIGGAKSRLFPMVILVVVIADWPYMPALLKYRAVMTSIMQR